MLEQRARHPARRHIPLGCDGIGAERPREVPGRSENHRDDGEDGIGAREQAVLGDETPRRGTVEHERKRRDHEQDGELRPRQDGDADRDQQQRIVPSPRRVRGIVQREHRPQERRVCDDLRQEQRREDDPWHADRQRGDQV